MGKTIGVISLKGGVGKTSVVASLGSAISESGKKVLLIDGNLSAPNLGIHFNIINPEKTLHDVLNRDVHPREAICCCGKFDLMPSAIFCNEKTNPLKLKDRIRSLKRKYDVIIIDSSPSLDDETLAVILASDELVVVTTPDVPTLSSTMKAIKLAKQRGTNISGVVLNKVHKKKFELSFDNVENTLDVPILAVIPYDLNVLKSVYEKNPYIYLKPNSKGVLEYKKLAGVLLGEKYSSRSIKGFFKKIAPSRQEINREIFYIKLFDN